MKKPVKKVIKIAIMDYDRYANDKYDIIPTGPEDGKDYDWFFSSGELKDDDLHYIRSTRAYILFISNTQKLYMFRNYKNEKVKDTKITTAVKKEMQSSLNHYMKLLKEYDQSFEIFSITL